MKVTPNQDWLSKAPTGSELTSASFHFVISKKLPLFCLTVQAPGKLHVSPALAECFQKTEETRKANRNQHGEFA